MGTRNGSGVWRKSKPWYFSHTIHENKFKMYHRPKCERYNNPACIEKIGEYENDFEIGNDFLNMI